MLTSLERGLRAMTDAANKMSSQCEIGGQKKKARQKLARNREQTRGCHSATE